MNGSAKITFAWGDSEAQVFRLPIGELRELETKTGHGPQSLATRLRTGEWRVDEPREILRLGLIGGGKEPTAAMALIARYFDVRPLRENLIPAMAIIEAALSGNPDEPQGELKGEGETSGLLSQTDEHAGANFTESASPPASAATRSTDTASGNLAPLSAAGPKPTARKRPSRRPARTASAS